MNLVKVQTVIDILIDRLNIEVCNLCSKNPCTEEDCKKVKEMFKFKLYEENLESISRDIVERICDE